MNEGNGYHDFTGEDVQKLFIIRKLREAGLSLADIRAILRKPRTTPFYLHKQMNELQTQMLTIQKTISEMDRLSGQLPVCQSLDQLAGMLEDTNFSPDEPPQFQMESRDARLLAQYLWMAYLDTPVTEYQQFLWQKIMQQTMELAHPAADRDAESGDRMDERLVEETPFFLLYRVRGKRKERSFQFFHKRRIIRPRESNDFLVPQILVNIRRINPLRGNRLQITGHHFQICPRMFHGLLKDFMDSPEGALLNAALNKAFNGNCDVRTGYYGELEVAATFHKSIYALLSPEQIREFLAGVEG